MHDAQIRFVLHVAYPDHAALNPHTWEYWRIWYFEIERMFDGVIPAKLRKGLSKRNMLLSRLCDAGAEKQKLERDAKRREDWRKRVDAGNAKALRNAKTNATEQQ